MFCSRSSRGKKRRFRKKKKKKNVGANETIVSLRTKFHGKQRTTSLKEEELEKTFGLKTAGTGDGKKEGGGRKEKRKEKNSKLSMTKILWKGNRELVGRGGNSIEFQTRCSRT